MSSIAVGSIANGVEDTLRALNNLADERGVKWKKRALIMAGDKAFKPVVTSSAANAPRATGLTKGAITASRPKYNASAARQISKSGKIRKGGRNEYVIGTTLRASVEQRLPLNHKGKRKRYPFMVEAGVSSGTYQRERFVRAGVIVSAHQYKRVKPRRPALFQHRALNTNASKVLSIWSKQMDYYISLYSKTTYKSLKSAIKADERSILTGRRSNKWV